MDVERPATGAAAGSMMALRARERGGPEVLVYEEAPVPRPGRDEICVAVHAAGITFAELTWPETWTSNGTDRTPIIPSHELAGVVTQVGAEVSDLSVGDAVFGLVPFNRDGAAAEFVVLPAADVTRKPAAVTDVDAAAAVLPALTAWEALRDHAHLEAGQRILILGGTGAVGAFLTQFAHGMNADVTVTVSSASNEARAKSLGANHVVVVGHDQEPDGLSGFDVVMDAVGGHVAEWLYASLRPGGQLVVLQEPPSEELAAKYGVHATFFVVTTRRDRLDELGALLAAGGIEVAVAQTFGLSAGRAAYESGPLPKPAPGKTVIVVA
ncbi:MAG: NADP-dependent oxidoreductase [Microbacteriaceae bacterium]|nr:NADP-dependent oxidoreductase [Microbacteriaceae bacterium]